jgi:hypothetical protein
LDPCEWLAVADGREVVRVAAGALGVRTLGRVAPAELGVLRVAATV